VGRAEHHISRPLEPSSGLRREPIVAETQFFGFTLRGIDDPNSTLNCSGPRGRRHSRSHHMGLGQCPQGQCPLIQLWRPPVYSTFSPGVSQHTRLGMIMSSGTSIYSYGCKPPITTENLYGTSCEQSGTIANAAPSQLGNEPQLAMDRLLRECLTPKSPRE